MVWGSVEASPDAAAEPHPGPGPGNGGAADGVHVPACRGHAMEHAPRRRQHQELAQERHNLQVDIQTPD